ncbi:thioesterase family protein [Dietzia massiliensis]|uniref:thioesterase family protein n=1 Tax=Dietzia massiliensis TaxID=2697499 RepID=UPI001BCFBD4A|nr:thioesterase family protein [Dietzia massiliensis]MBS7548393.1 thioesterase family protein [Dietzia massiliensis]
MRQNLPSVEEVDQIPAACSTVAAGEWEDGNGHVNVAHFYGFHIRGAEEELRRVGIDEAYRASRRMGVFSMEQHLKFFDEVRIGEEISVHVRWLDRGDKVFHGISVIVNRTTGRIANTLEMIEGHVDLTARRTAPFPAGVAQRIDEQVAAHRGLGWQLPLSGAMAVRH